VQANVGSHCVDCAKAERPPIATRARYWNARQPTLVTYILIAVNVAVFIGLGIQDADTLTGRGRVSQGQFDLGLNEFFIEQGEWYRLVTSGFVHFGFIHVGFNMFLLYQLGQLLEPAVGRVRFTLLYFAGLLGGSAGVLLLPNNSITAGASGAVFGLMGAAFVGMRNRGINPFSTGIGTLLLLNLLITFSIPGISIGGHLGGVVAGAIAGWFVLAPPWKGVPKWATYAGPGAVILVSLVISYVATR
jgi:membrane associated rhomboid family serine protease